MNMSKYKWLEDYIMSKPGITKSFKEEWNWYSYKVGDKVVAVYCEPDSKYEKCGGHDILTLKCEPHAVDDLCMSFEDIVPGFYVSKINNITLFLDGELEKDFIKELYDKAYDIIFKKLTKKKQNEILSKL